MTKTQIGKAEDISPAYVEQILTALRGARLVTSHIGSRGGFSLARDPNSITVADILAPTEGPLQIVPCAESHCSRASACATAAVWEKATRALEDVFAGTTLKDMAEDARARQDAGAPSFTI